MFVRRTALVATLLALSVGTAAAAPAGDKAGCSDHPLFPTRMPRYSIAKCEAKEFERVEFHAKKGPRPAHEGKYTFLQYVIGDRKDEASGVAVIRNYESALQQAGGTIVEQDPQRWITGKIVQGGKAVWVEAEKGNGSIWLRIVEEQAMAQHVVADAAALGQGLGATGHVAVYGVYFDTGKADVKPESTPALEEIAKLLAGDPSLKLWVVGHTDAVGKLDDNLKLSKARAEAVVKVLSAKHGVAAARLQGYGVGPLAPVATNADEEGRAKNRRVELVKP